MRPWRSRHGLLRLGRGPPCSWAALVSMDTEEADPFRLEVVVPPVNVEEISDVDVAFVGW